MAGLRDMSVLDRSGGRRRYAPDTRTAASTAVNSGCRPETEFGKPIRVIGAAR
jgi:hypothetical protein